MVYLLLLKTNQHRRYFKEKCFCVSFSHLLRWDSLCMDIREWERPFTLYCRWI